MEKAWICLSERGATAAQRSSGGFISWSSLVRYHPEKIRKKPAISLNSRLSTAVMSGRVGRARLEHATSGVKFLLVVEGWRALYGFFREFLTFWCRSGACRASPPGPAAAAHLPIFSLRLPAAWHLSGLPRRRQVSQVSLSGKCIQEIGPQACLARCAACTTHDCFSAAWLCARWQKMAPAVALSLDSGTALAQLPLADAVPCLLFNYICRNDYCFRKSSINHC